MRSTLAPVLAPALALLAILVAVPALSGCGDGAPPGSTDAALRDLATAESDMTSEIPCGGPQKTPCPMGMFCETAIGQCCCDKPGICRPIPVTCNKVPNPVCGCDDATYENDCQRQQASMSAASAGMCP